MPFVVAPEEKAELLCTFAALLLHDEGLKIDGDNIQKLITAAGAQVDAFWPKLYANMLANKKVADLLTAAPAGGGGGGAAAPAAAAAGATDKKGEDKKGGDKKGADKKGGADKKEKAKEKEKEKEADDEEGGDLGFSLFG